MTDEAAPFGESSVSASIPGLPSSQLHVALKDGVDPFKAAVKFKQRFIEEFGAEAVQAALSQGAPRPMASASNGASDGDAPKCNLHNRAMKPSSKGGGWYCSAKLGDGSYCKEKVAA